MTLQIFEKHLDMDAYKVGASFTPYAIMAVDKRFTDAELAAEYWNLNYYMAGAQFNEVSSEQPYSEEFWETQTERANTLHRFINLPHYDADMS